jgi:probable lipoprotein (TIGR04455 family)
MNVNTFPPMNPLFRPDRFAAFAVGMLFVMPACSVVKASRVTDDWSSAHATKVKRLTVVVQPPPDGQQKAGEAWSRIVRRYVNMKRNFLVRAELVQAEPMVLTAVCVDGTEGVLWLKPQVTPKGDGFEASVDAKLLRCGDGLELWAGEAGGSFPTTDPKLIEVTAMYGKEYAPEVERYIPLAMNLLRPLLDTLPDPVLTNEEQEEKVTVDE